MTSDIQKQFETKEEIYHIITEDLLKISKTDFLEILV